MERAALLYIIYIVSSTLCVMSTLGEQVANGGPPAPETGECSCGGFAEGGTQPLVAHPAGPATACSAGGTELCRDLCLALATAAQAKGHGVLCAKLGKVDQLKISVHHKICNEEWTFSGLTMDEPLCCENGAAKTCLLSAKTDEPATPSSNPTTT